MALCNKLTGLIGKYNIGDSPVWRTKVHSDGSIWEGWFLLGIFTEHGKQITYHLPDKYWDECKKFAKFVAKAPEYDGHTAQDVLERLKTL